MLDSSTQRLIAHYGSYELQVLVWRDAFVAEYEAISVPSGQSEGGRRVTVKVLKSDAVRHEGIAADFIRDAERWLSLRAPNVRALVDFGYAEDLLYVCSEPFAGQSVSELTRAGLEGSVARPWSLCVAHIMAEACRAAEMAYHGSGQQNGLLIHGGISPHTITIGNDGVVRLDDFAFARAHARVRNALSRDTARTLPYLAPEQLGHAHALTRQVDVWSLGVCMWEMLTGRSLFLGDSDAATLLALTVGAVPAPSASDPSVPPELDAIAQRCIARNPSERYSSVSVMEADLRAFITRQGGAIEAFELAALVRERESLDLTNVSAHASPGPFQSMEGYRRRATAPNIETVPWRAPGHRRNTIALGLLSALLVMVTVVGVWIWQERPGRATLPRYEASRSSLRAAGDYGVAGAATTPGSEDPGEPAEARRMAGAGRIPTVRGNADDDQAGAANHALDSGASAASPQDETEAITEERSRSERRSRRSGSSSSGRSRRDSDDGEREDGEEAEMAAVPARAEEARTATASASPSTVAPPAPRLELERSLPVREAPPEPVRKAPPEPVRRPADATAASDAKASISGVTVQGAVPRAAIQRALDRAAPGFRSCYLNASTKLGRSPAGSVSVQMVIDESNQAKVTKIGSAPLSGMDDCIRHAAARVKSQTPPDVGGVRVTFEIRFAPVR